MNRRNFLRGCLAVTALAIVQVPDLHAYPILYGDGIHDDTEALQALMDLKPYVCEGKLIEGQTKAILEGGTYKVSGTIHINKDIIMNNCHLIGDGFDGPLLHLKPGNYNNAHLSNIIITAQLHRSEDISFIQIVNDRF